MAFSTKKTAKNMLACRMLLAAAERLHSQGILPIKTVLMAELGWTSNFVQDRRRKLAAEGRWPWLAISIAAERKEVQESMRQRAREAKDSRLGEKVAKERERETAKLDEIRRRLEAAYAARRRYGDDLSPKRLAKAMEAVKP